MAGIRRALRHEDWQTVASLAHSIKGSVGFFDAAAPRNHEQELLDLAYQPDRPAAASVYSLLGEEIAKLQANLRGYAETNGLCHLGPDQ